MKAISIQRNKHPTHHHITLIIKGFPVLVMFPNWDNQFPDKTILDMRFTHVYKGISVISNRGQMFRNMNFWCGSSSTKCKSKTQACQHRCINYPFASVCSAWHLQYGTLNNTKGKLLLTVVESNRPMHSVVWKGHKYNHVFHNNITEL